MEVFTLCCDIDGQTHGCFSNPANLIDVAEKILNDQPFYMPVEEKDLYIQKFVIDTSFDELVEYIEFKNRYTE